MRRLQTHFLGIEFQNPFIAGAGAFGYDMRHVDWTDPNRWGGISLKGLTLHPQAGHAYPRMHKLPYGLINGIGLNNPGWSSFLNYYGHHLHHLTTNLIINLNAKSEDELMRLVQQVSKHHQFKLLEVNLSCPNIESGGLEWGHDPQQVGRIVRKVKGVLTHQKLIVKLNGVLINLAVVAQAAERAGADAISLINSVPAMLIDSEQMRPVLGSKFGGLSGPAIKPIALRAVYKVFEAVSIPIIGMGGIANAQDAVEFLLAGASMVELGTVLWQRPESLGKIIDDFNHYLEQKNIKNWQDLIGQAH